ncbi:MAG: DUF4124 domain-containing protein [Gammaproteobacteria bacterium]|nr:DUF4124 domain-containing protein [Gammaproteobacteria bacterium]
MFKFLLVICLLGAGYYLYQHPDLLTKAKELPQQTGLIESSTEVYKWQDTDGNWQISDKPPANGIPYEKLKYDHDANVMPSLAGQKQKK